MMRLLKRVKGDDPEIDAVPEPFPTSAKTCAWLSGAGVAFTALRLVSAAVERVGAQLGLGVGGFVVATGFAVAAGVLSREVRRRNQEERDANAQRLVDEANTRNYEKITAGGEEVAPFVLYLRPFAIELKLRERRPLFELLGSKSVETYKRGSIMN